VLRARGKGGFIMRKVLAVITAVVLAAIVFAPAMGYTISNQGKTNYTINSQRVNYSIGSGTPAHETVYSEEMAEHYPTYSISSTPTPYSVKMGGMTKYSIKPESNPTKIEALGGYKATLLGTAEKLGNGLVLPKEPENKTEQASAQPAPAAKPVASNVMDLTKPENVAKPNATAPANTTKTNVSAPANVTVPAPAPVEVKSSIMGKVADENKTGLADVKVNLEQPAKTVIANATTSKDGSYSFPGLMSGDYVVAEVLPANWTAVTPTEGMANVTLKDKDMTVDFVNKMMPAPAPAVPAVNQTSANTTAPK
jgi:hypothetical protein